jgi:hypothetical protein
MAEAVAGMAEVRLTAGELTTTVELLAFLQAWSPSPHAVRERAAALLVELEAELPAEQFAAATTRGQARQVDDVVAELVRERGEQAATPHMLTGGEEPGV